MDERPHWKPPRPQYKLVLSTELHLWCRGNSRNDGRDPGVSAMGSDISPRCPPIWWRPSRRERLAVQPAIPGHRPEPSVEKSSVTGGGGAPPPVTLDFSTDGSGRCPGIAGCTARRSRRLGRHQIGGHRGLMSDPIALTPGSLPSFLEFPRHQRCSSVDRTSLY